ncbi:MAG TPA: ABC transporter ATP-binding protein [Rhodospirillales bacterium]|nr:ABC transporter ATP-binding protein [Rhodospirillales bacterium]
MSLLVVERLTRSFGGVRAVQDLSFAIPAGGTHSIIGPNGAGKTTLFNLVTGVLRPTRGSIRFKGEEIAGLPPERLAARGISRTFQNLQIFFNMSVVENVLVGSHLALDRNVLRALLRLPRLRRVERRARREAEALLERVGLAEWRDAPADSLPYGALKRLEIARALAGRPELLLLDEPAAGCNDRETREIEALLQSLVADGITIVLVEHDMRLVMNVSDHIIVLDHGQMLAEGDAEKVRNDPAVIEAYLGQAALAGGHAS